jgi:TRAP-type C4-dicarboxylate transport system permease small subunit
MCKRVGLSRVRESLRFHYVWRSYFLEQFYNSLVGFCKKLNAVVCRLILIYAGAIAGLIIANGITRMAGYPMPWTEELSRWLLIGICFAGSSVAIRKGLHVGITMLVEIVPLSIKRPLIFAGNLLVAVFLLFFICITAVTAFKSGQETGTVIKVPLALPYLQMPLCGILIFLQILPFLIGPFAKNTAGEEFLLTQLLSRE